MRRLVILRPEPGASATLERAGGIGLDACALPLFRIEPMPWEVLDPSAFDALLLTSANAVRADPGKLARLRHLPAYAIGEATAATARDAGLRVEAVGGGDIDDLLRLVPKALRLLHLCGRDRRAADLAGRSIEQVEVYRAQAVAVSGIAERLRDQVAAVHSPRAGERLAELVAAADRQAIRIAAISPPAAAAVGVGWACVEHAAVPTDDALLALAARLCEEDPRQ